MCRGTCPLPAYSYDVTQWRSHGGGGGQGGRVPPLTAKNLPKIGKKRDKIRKIWKKEEKSGRKGTNREVSFTLPLQTDTVGYAIDVTDHIVQT